MKNTSYAIERVKELMTEMNAWESEFYLKKMELILAGKSTTLLSNEFRERLKDILEKNVIDKGKNYGRLIDLGAGDPPTYDFPTDEVINYGVEGRSKFIYIYRRSAGFKNSYRLTLKLSDGKWMVEKSELFSDRDKWERICI